QNVSEYVPSTGRCTIHRIDETLVTVIFAFVVHDIRQPIRKSHYCVAALEGQCLVAQAHLLELPQNEPPASEAVYVAPSPSYKGWFMPRDGVCERSPGRIENPIEDSHEHLTRSLHQKSFVDLHQYGRRTSLAAGLGAN